MTIIIGYKLSIYANIKLGQWAYFCIFIHIIIFYHLDLSLNMSIGQSFNCPLFFKMKITWWIKASGYRGHLVLLVYLHDSVVKIWILTWSWLFSTFFLRIFTRSGRYFMVLVKIHSTISQLQWVFDSSTITLYLKV